jgi:hypothetical protein
MVRELPGLVKKNSTEDKARGRTMYQSFFRPSLTFRASS